jgi:hypothetical protein
MRFGIGVLAAAMLPPLARRASPLVTVRGIGMGLVAAAVVSVERARLRAIAGSRGIGRRPLRRAS